MFKPKRVIIAAVVLAVLSMAGMLVSMLQPETHGGLAADTFGVRPHGIRAFYETVEAAGFEVRRGFAPPHAAMADENGAGWLILWRPEPGFVYRDERYLEELGAWVNSGGAVLFTPAFDAGAYFDTSSRCDEKDNEAIVSEQNGTDGKTVQQNKTSEEHERDEQQRRWTDAQRGWRAERFHVLEPLQRMGVGVKALALTDFAGRIAEEQDKLDAFLERQRDERERRRRERGACTDEDGPAQDRPTHEGPGQDGSGTYAPPHTIPADPNTTALNAPAVRVSARAETPQREYGWYDYQKFLRAMELDKRAERATGRSVSTRGELGSFWQGLDTVTMADETQYLPAPDEGEPEPDGALAFETHNGATGYLAAAYSKGKGLIVVVADPLILANAMLDKPGNAYTALGPLRHAGRSGAVVFDEFFHGLSVRGNPAWLLTRRPYGLVVLALTLAAAVWCWRSGFRLGPPLPPVEPSRRTVEEYLEAMSGLFLRGEKQAFLARELTAGVLWQLARRYRLGVGQDNLEAVSRAMARRDPDGARRLRDAVHELETLAAQRKPPVRRLVAAARELTRCL
ncbi:hypothetical protein DPQ33_01070 [Oceanidesulfovibrio indonesiensis]|uniref:DUF4350 domain-containing protein n=1 Tax=Oceanidesulfovibrio indonesiensis TaxID=54767 RepID=A0A7M3MJ84_9BACT|nr:DUF4350 domain-containing protein [Oceanidesulfovibrio indonesiensis]TVM19854.1 hypothetical protein DPQ33_01070 [Oceanidesulfovibrio indonesiensis]